VCGLSVRLFCCLAIQEVTAPEEVSAFVDQLQATGTYTFSHANARAALPTSEIAVDNALRRLKKRSRIVTPRRGFYVIVPTEYITAGSPPPSWFIDDLMGFLGQPYYVGLLSAAAIQGASHQQPMTFQVVTDRPTREGVAGRAHITFHMSGSVAETPAARCTRARRASGRRRCRQPLARDPESGSGDRSVIPRAQYHGVETCRRWPQFVVVSLCGAHGDNLIDCRFSFTEGMQ
jgi:hypothetical protein